MTGMIGMLPMFLIPLVILGAWMLINKSKFTVKEFLLSELVITGLLVATFFIARYGAIVDTETWNGEVSAKIHEKHSCCHCRTVCDSRDDDGNCTSSHEECDHSRDYRWALEYSTGDRDTIKKCAPPRNKDDHPQVWVDAYVGEPAAKEHSYPNYLLADPESLHYTRGAAEQFTDVGFPSYPKHFGYYRQNRALNHGGTQMPMTKMNDGLAEINKELGHGKQVNIIVVATPNADPAYADGLEETWLYGKKNDCIFVLGAPDGDKIAWARIVTISNVAELRTNVMHYMPGMKLSDHETILDFIHERVLRDFERDSLGENFGFLMANATPSTTAKIVMYIVALILTIILGFVCQAYDIFGDEGSGARRLFGGRGHGGFRGFRVPSFRSRRRGRY